MGLFDRFKRVVKSNINEMISKAEDPEKMLNQLIIDMNQQLIESKKSVASAIADEKKLERDMNKELDEATEWERKARLALEAGKEDLAKEALLRKQEHTNYAVQYKQQYAAQHGSVDSLKNSLRTLQQKIEEAQRKKNLLVARAKRAEAQQKIQKTIGGMGDTGAFEAFERMAQKVDQIEAEADALQEMSQISADGNLNEQFKALEKSSTSADLLLEDLKSRMKNESGT
jgi:phage shock protein A